MIQPVRRVALGLRPLTALSMADRRELFRDLKEAITLSMSTGHPRPVVDVLRGWMATAEYILAGEPFSRPIDWDEVVHIERPTDLAAGETQRVDDHN